MEKKIAALKRRNHDPLKLEQCILELCEQSPLKAEEIAEHLGRGKDYIKRRFLTAMVSSGKLCYTHPEKLNHPEQAYRKKETGPEVIF